MQPTERAPPLSIHLRLPAIWVDILCLSGCFSKPLGVVSRSASSVLSQDSSPVSASVRQRRGLPGVPGRVPLVRGLQVPPMRARSWLRAGGTKTLAVRRLSSPSLPDIGDNPSQYEDPADPLVLGGLPDDDRQARRLGVASPASAWSSAL